MTYTQLTQEQRYQVYALLKTEHSQTKIATAIGVHKSTINREIRRNCGKRGYKPKQVQRYSLKRRRNKVTKRITAETWARIDEKLRHGMYIALYRKVQWEFLNLTRMPQMDFVIKLK